MLAKRTIKESLYRWNSYVENGFCVRFETCPSVDESWQNEMHVGERGVGGASDGKNGGS